MVEGVEENISSLCSLSDQRKKDEDTSLRSSPNTSTHISSPPVHHLHLSTSSSSSSSPSSSSLSKIPRLQSPAGRSSSASSSSSPRASPHHYISNLRNRLPSSEQHYIEDDKSTCTNRTTSFDAEVIELKNGRRKSLSKMDSESIRLARSQHQHNDALEELNSSRPCVPSDDVRFPHLRDTYRNELHGAFRVLLSQAETSHPVEQIKSPSTEVLSNDSPSGNSFLATLTDESMKEEDELLSFELFSSWSEIKDVIEEGTLGLDVIEREFETLAVMDASGTCGIDFESFCLVMENLESAWQELSDYGCNRDGDGSEIADNELSDVRESDVARGNILLSVDTSASTDTPPRNRLLASEVVTDDIESDDDITEERASDLPESSAMDSRPTLTTIEEMNQVREESVKVQKMELNPLTRLLLAASKRPIVNEATRQKIWQDAALVGMTVSSRYKQEAKLEAERVAQEVRLEKYLEKKAALSRKTKVVERESEVLFEKWREKLRVAEDAKVHDENVISQQRLIDFEEKRQSVLWRILMECDKKFFKPSECRDLTRLYLHLKRATTVDSSKMTSLSYQRAAEKLSQLSNSVKDMQCLVIEEKVPTSSLEGFMLQPFPCVQWLQLVAVPPSVIEDFKSVQSQLIRLEIVNSGIHQLSDLFGCPTISTRRRLKSFQNNYAISTESSVPVSFVLPLESFVEVKGKHQVNLLWPNLLFLRLSNCGLTHVDAALYLLPFVKQMDLSHNDLSSLTNLRGCLNLRTINLSHNRLSSLTHIGHAMRNMQRLNLSYNHISSLNGLQHLIYLEKVDISYNSITRIDEVEHVIKLKLLKDLQLMGNPVATIYANNEQSGDEMHRHPMWETLLHQHEKLWYNTPSDQRSRLAHNDITSRLQRPNELLYRLMVFAYFYPEMSQNGRYRTREMIVLDGEAITDFESAVIRCQNREMSSIFLPPEVSPDIFLPLEAMSVEVMSCSHFAGESISVRRRSSCASRLSDLTAGMLEYESASDDNNNVPEEDMIDFRERYWSGADTVTSALSANAVESTREDVYHRVMRRHRHRNHEMFSDSTIPHHKKTAVIVDDKVAEHAALLRYLLVT